MKRALSLLLVGVLCVASRPEGRQDASGEADFKGFLAEWERGQTRFINGDPSFWKAHTSRGADVTILGGFGGYGEKGWDAVGARYDWASSQYKPGGATLAIEYVHVAVSGDLAYTVGIERQTGSRVGDEESPGRRALRVTQVFRREHGAWKLLHRHADPLVERVTPGAPLPE